MAEEEYLLTQEGFDKLKAEKDQLIHVEREKNKEELVAARNQGDLSENADYDAARNRQAEIEARIKEIDFMLNHCKIISKEDLDLTTVKPGSTVTILDLSSEDNKPETYTIVGTTETNPFDGRISNECPVAKAVLGHGINEVVTVGVADPYNVRILKIEFSENA